MNEDTLFPHSDEAGRVPGAMSNQMPMETLDRIVADSRKVERQRLVWEAMLAYISFGGDRRLLVEMAVNDADKYLAWRDEQ